MDYVRRRLQLDLSLWVGDMRGPGDRETYRPAHLNFDEVAFLIVELPDVGRDRIDAAKLVDPKAKPWDDGVGAAVSGSIGEAYAVPNSPSCHSISAGVSG